MSYLQDGDIVINTKHITKGDVFFCFKEAEKYISEKNLQDASKVYCTSGFVDRVFSESGCLHGVDVNKYKAKIYEKDYLNNFLVESLKTRYHQPTNLIAITGTKGKTSTAWYVMQILGFCGKKCGYIGTIGVYSFDGIELQKLNKDYTLTTPDIDELYRYLHKFKQLGIDNVVFEASSHALKQGRLNGLDIKYACFTNLSQDHLDYHKTMEEYFTAKSLLFLKYLNQNKGICIINNEDNYGKKLVEICQKHNLSIKTIGLAEDNDLIVKSIKQLELGQEVCFFANGKTYDIYTEILGEFQILNIAEAIEICCSIDGIEYSDVCKSFSKIVAPIGRMQKVLNTNIFIDFAHTPKSLEESIKLLRSRYKKVAVLFGCGGNRDRQKRPIMCEIATKMANFVVITSDNLRHEKPEEIIKDITCFLRKDYNNELINDEFIKNEIKNIDAKYNDDTCEIKVIENRHEAIDFIVNKFLNVSKLAVVIAGKGHEDYQIIGEKKKHFSDYEEVQKAITKLK